MINEYLPNPAIIKKITPEAHDTKTYFIEYLEKNLHNDIAITPGQFMMLSRFGAGESAISLSDTTNNGLFTFTIRKVGNVTNSIINLKEDDHIGIRGPYGTGWPLKKAEGRDVLIVAGGMGIAPLRGVITHIMNNRNKYEHLEIIYGARTPYDMIFSYEFEKWKKIKNCKLELTVDSMPVEFSYECRIGLVTSCFPQMKTTHRNSIVFLCGPEIMMRYAAKCLETIGFKDNQIVLSLERRMKCGIGKCGHCQIGLKYVCKDGPVFNYSDIKTFIHPL